MGLGRGVAVVILLCVATGGRGDEGPPGAVDGGQGEHSAKQGKRVSCSDIGEVWQDLCRQGGCFLPLP